jgi:hypothetical protein
MHEAAALDAADSGGFQILEEGALFGQGEQALLVLKAIAQELVLDQHVAARSYIPVLPISR